VQGGRRQFFRADLDQQVAGCAHGCLPAAASIGKPSASRRS
jgi:hypothetical protein